MKEKQNGMLFDNNKFPSFFLFALLLDIIVFVLLFVCAIPMQILFETFIHANVSEWVMHISFLSRAIFLHVRNQEWNFNNSKKGKNETEHLFLLRKCAFTQFLHFIFASLVFLLIFFFCIFPFQMFSSSSNHPCIQPCKHNDFSDGFRRTHVIALMLYCMCYMK